MDQELYGPRGPYAYVRVIAIEVKEAGMMPVEMEMYRLHVPFSGREEDFLNLIDVLMAVVTLQVDLVELH